VKISASVSWSLCESISAHVLLHQYMLKPEDVALGVKTIIYQHPTMNIDRIVMDPAH
jgi:NADP-dependent 3-hydroxy acid dehydrogenase YdfG